MELQKDEKLWWENEAENCFYNENTALKLAELDVMRWQSFWEEWRALSDWKVIR